MNQWLQSIHVFMRVHMHNVGVVVVETNKISDAGQVALSVQVVLFTLVQYTGLDCGLNTTCYLIFKCCSCLLFTCLLCKMLYAHTHCAVSLILKYKYVLHFEH